jgi:hypothetical protein
MLNIGDIQKRNQILLWSELSFIHLIHYILTYLPQHFVVQHVFKKHDCDSTKCVVSESHPNECGFTCMTTCEQVNATSLQ